jgi:glucose/arabinose dehydrogenase
VNVSSIFAQVVALVGGTMVQLRHKGTNLPQAIGATPSIPAAVPQGTLPTLKMPTARGWSGGRKPIAAPGLKVNAFAEGLVHPRWIEVLPNGDVLVAEALNEPGKPNSLFDWAMQVTMARAKAVGTNPNRITLLRDANKDGVAEVRHDYITGLNMPFGMALVGDTLYVGNTDGMVSFAYKAGETQVTAKGKRLTTYKPGGHWTRSILRNKAGTKLYVGVGSLSNIAEQGFEAEVGRAMVYEYDIASGTQREFATGLRNPVGLAWEPSTETLFTVVNERDGIGDETPPDYLTSVRDSAFYGWPYSYWNKIVDDRVQPQDAKKVAGSMQPDFALGGHTASLGLCWLPAGTLPGFGEGMVIGQHGSWNRSKLSGYRVIHVPFKDGKPVGPARDILTGFLSDDENESWGRPVGVRIGPDGSLLVADDVGDVIWRVTGA